LWRRAGGGVRAGFGLAPVKGPAGRARARKISLPCESGASPKDGEGIPRVRRKARPGRKRFK